VDLHTGLMIGAILLTAFIALRILRFFLSRYLDAASERLNVDPTNYYFFKNTLSAIIYLLAISLSIYMIPSLRTLALGLLAGAGIFAAIIGFASQAAFANMVSGIFIVIFKPLRVHDIVKIGNLYYGVVEDITLRHTVIRDFENKRIVIPNAVMSTETITNSNMGDTRIRRHVDFGISYDSDVNLAIKIIREEAIAHPSCLDWRTPEDENAGSPQVIVRVIGFGDSAVLLKAYVWAENQITAFEMHCDLNKSVKERFDAEGIEIPFPYRTLVFKDPPALFQAEQKKT